ncbi:MAG: FG-GAP repeat protein [Planctomycetes bacterium]|nr:FG-GAP repeat protein [Planctomycetota bacterium]
MSSLLEAGLLALAGGALLAAPAAAQLHHHDFSATATDGQFGRAVSAAFDVNHDGILDVLVGEPNDDDHGSDSGSAYVYSGQDWSVLLVLHGAAAGDHFEFAVAGLGDVNGDGFDDLAVGAPDADLGGDQTGSVSVVSGKNGATLYVLHGTRVGEHFGYSVARAGDIDGDGLPDLVAGAPDYDGILGGLTFAGRARVFKGNTGTQLLQFVGAQWDRMGWDVAGAGDVDGDGRDDVLLSASGDQSLGDLTGRIEVRSGRDGAVIFKRYASTTLTSYGGSVVGVGDIDHDGYADVAVSAYSEDDARGAVHVYRGPNGVPAYTFVGAAPGDQFGASLDGAGDVDQDGTGDLVVGTSPLGGSGYSARVLSLATGLPLGDDLVSPGTPTFGREVAGLGDVSGDGWADLALGAPYALAPNGKQGVVSVVSPVVVQPDLGFGGPGGATLAMYGAELAAGLHADLRLEDAAPNRPALLCLSLDVLGAPFKGGVLVPDVGAGIGVVLVTGPDGAIRLLGVPGGGGPLDVFIQYVVQDPTQAKGFALSNAIAASFLP